MGPLRATSAIAKRTVTHIQICPALPSGVREAALCGLVE